MENKIKNSLFIFLFVILLLPLIQQYFHFITSGPLYGYSQESPDVSFSWDEWWSRKYQDQKSQYLNDNIGFRPDLVRFNNQWDYYFFKKLHSWKVVEGTNHNLYMDTYIDDYFGRNYMG